MSEVLRTNELENAIDYLEKATYHHHNRDDYYWFKWLVISLHGALYGFGVCAIKGSSTNRVLQMKMGKKKYQQKKEEILKIHRDDSDFDFNKSPRLLDDVIDYNLSSLLDINTVIKKCQDESYMMQRENSRTLEINPLQQKAIDELVKHRNDFAHFKPVFVSIITEGSDWIVKEVIEIIRFLALDSNNITYFKDGTREKVERLLEDFFV